MSKEAEKVGDIFRDVLRRHYVETQQDNARLIHDALYKVGEQLEEQAARHSGTQTEKDLLLRAEHTKQLAPVMKEFFEKAAAEMEAERAKDAE